MASDPLFFSTAKCWTGILSAANAGRDGTGTIVDIVTPGASGSKIERIVIQATSTTTTGFVRLFVYNGTASRLLREIAVTAATPSGSVAAFRSEVDLSFPSQVLVLPTTFKLQASTHNAEAFNVIAFGADA
jgi:hypothetical protein